jgi:hypothetical protein
MALFGALFVGGQIMVFTYMYMQAHNPLILSCLFFLYTWSIFYLIEAHGDCVCDGGGGRDESGSGKFPTFPQKNRNVMEI